ncbi:DinB family protein [Sinomonas sp. JGH33]|uniref:DinB family protein n=1 Tax=Sinomonas terricola TaxID=3110330 RepID=A0ABU5T182_9MICC|nr:DinB family protein [Sinomonas sp. JGH33]MEA5453409.1 DinB family protein [Sinomonas sp. JGH33]
MEPQPTWAQRILEDGFGRVRESVEHVLLGLSPEKLVEQPGPTANSVGWLVWHLTRITDDHFAALSLVLDGAEPPRDRRAPMPPNQLWPSWRPRFGTPYPESSTGFGHTAENVADFPRIDPRLLADYHAAVHERAVHILRGLTEEDWGRIVDFRWNPPVIVAVRLVSILNDATQHVGQAAYVKGLLGH